MDARALSGDLFAVSRSQLDTVWPHVLPLLQRFESETQTMTVEVMRQKVERAEAQLWCYAEDGIVLGVGLTEICEHSTGRFCRVWAIAGDLEPALVPIAEMVEEWARSLGCVAMEINGRKGWARKLPGYKVKAYVIEKDLRMVH